MARDRIELGEIEVRVLDDGIFITDAGNVFGGDRRARIKGAMHPVLVLSGEHRVLIDAGFGRELPEMLEGRYEIRREDDGLVESLKQAELEPEDVTHVVLSHLDPDHVGWALNPRGFPNATVYVQGEALEEARGMPETDGRRLAVPSVEEGLEEGWCELLDGDGEIVPGVRVEVRAGHSAGHQVVWIGSGDAVALYTADLAPARIWLDPDLIAGVDTDPEAARRNRIEILREAERLEAPVLLYHEPTEPVVRIRASGEKFEGVPLEG